MPGRGCCDAAWHIQHLTLSRPRLGTSHWDIYTSTRKQDSSPQPSLISTSSAVKSHGRFSSKKTIFSWAQLFLAITFLNVGIRPPCPIYGRPHIYFIENKYISSEHLSTKLQSPALHQYCPTHWPMLTRVAGVSRCVVLTGAKLLDWSPADKIKTKSFTPAPAASSRPSPCCSSVLPGPSQNTKHKTAFYLDQVKTKRGWNL